MHISEPPGHVIVIVGAGFCGTMVATHLLGAARGGNTKIYLVNKPHAGAESSMLARGLAYGTSSPDHLLNVPAGRMSAFEDRPDDFVDFLHANDIVAEGGSFVGRRWYGAYLQKTLRDAASNTDAGFSVLHRTVSSVQRIDDDGVRHRILFTEGDPVVADRIVLALGNFAPAHPHAADNVFVDSPRYIRDPWRERALDDLDLTKPVLLIGSGLTMFDMVISFDARCKAEQNRTDQAAAQSMAALSRPAAAPLRIHVVSRRGLWPQSHRQHTSSPLFDAAPPGIFATASARAYLRAVRAQVDTVEASGGDWRDVVASLRPITPGLWAQLPMVERRRFLRHLKPFWETHRHRAAPAIFDSVAGYVARGEIKPMAAQILAFEAHSHGVYVTMRRRGSSDTNGIVRLDVGAVINCTGPSSEFSAEPLLAQMAADGLIVADPLRQGIEVAADYRVVDAGGNSHGGIYYVGPLLKARDWEATAVPELRKHAVAAADSVLKTVASK